MPMMPAGLLPIASQSLHACLAAPVLGSINFLNEVIDRYPDAISFAPGAPSPAMLEEVDIASLFDRYVEHLCKTDGLSQAAVRRRLFQYGPSRGIINPLLADALRADQGIDVSPQSIVVTVGFQEAFFLSLRALFADAGDVLAVVQPCFVGAVGAARVLGIETVAVNEGRDGIDLDNLRAVCARARLERKRIRGLYVAPDYANPSGTLMSLNRREALLEVARQEGLVLFEDAAYGFTGPDEAWLPSLRSLDHSGHVIHFGTFAKIGVPGLRVGFVVADQTVSGGSLLADQLAAIKSMITVNTSPICQAVVGAMILNHGHSLLAMGRDKGRFYRARLTRLLAALDRQLGATTAASGALNWSRPTGGFFVRLNVPAVVDEQLLELSAREYGVLWTPMAPFYLDDSGRHELRLSCSYLSDDQIDEGAARLGRFLRDGRVGGGQP